MFSGISEKSYRATAYLFLFDGDVFRSTNPQQNPKLPLAINLFLDLTRTQLEQSFADGLIDLAEDAPLSQQLFWAWNLSRLSEQKIKEFYARFEQLVLEFAPGGTIPRTPMKIMIFDFS